jgi:hypothetical protein
MTATPDLLHMMGALQVYMKAFEKLWTADTTRIHQFMNLAAGRVSDTRTSIYDQHGKASQSEWLLAIATVFVLDDLPVRLKDTGLLSKQEQEEGVRKSLFTVGRRGKLKDDAEVVDADIRTLFKALCAIFALSYAIVRPHEEASRDELETYERLKGHLVRNHWLAARSLHSLEKIFTRVGEAPAWRTLHAHLLIFDPNSPLCTVAKEGSFEAHTTNREESTVKGWIKAGEPYKGQKGGLKKTVQMHAIQEATNHEFGKPETGNVRRSDSVLAMFEDEFGEDARFKPGEKPGPVATEGEPSEADFKGSVGPLFRQQTWQSTEGGGWEHAVDLSAVHWAEEIRPHCSVLTTWKENMISCDQAHAKLSVLYPDAGGLTGAKRVSYLFERTVAFRMQQVQREIEAEQGESSPPAPRAPSGTIGPHTRVKDITEEFKQPTDDSQYDPATATQKMRLLPRPTDDSGRRQKAPPIKKVLTENEKKTVIACLGEDATVGDLMGLLDADCNSKMDAYKKSLQDDGQKSSGAGLKNIRDRFKAWDELGEVVFRDFWRENADGSAVEHQPPTQGPRANWRGIQGAPA